MNEYRSIKNVTTEMTPDINGEVIHESTVIWEVENKYNVHSWWWKDWWQSHVMQPRKVSLNS